jgi:hypothetical protein
MLRQLCQKVLTTAKDAYAHPVENSQHFLLAAQQWLQAKYKRVLLLCLAVQNGSPQLQGTAVRRKVLCIQHKHKGKGRRGDVRGSARNASPPRWQVVDVDPCAGQSIGQRAR